MKLINHVAPAHQPRGGQVIEPPDALHGDDMVVVNGSHGVIQTAVERYSLEIVLFDIRCNIAHRLIEQVIHSDGRIAAVTLRNGDPQLYSELAPRLGLFSQLEEPAGIDLAAMLLVILISGRA